MVGTKLVFLKPFNHFAAMKIILDGLPSSSFFATIEEKSCVVIDDQYDEAIADSAIRQAFKVDRRHSQFSLILITQAIFDNGRTSKGIRNNNEIWVLFKNFG